MRSTPSHNRVMFNVGSLQDAPTRGGIAATVAAPAAEANGCPALSRPGSHRMTVAERLGARSDRLPIARLWRLNGWARGAQ